jgi:hypothetical protein
VEVVEETLKGHTVRFLEQKKEGRKKLGGAEYFILSLRHSLIFFLFCFFHFQFVFETFLSFFLIVVFVSVLDFLNVFSFQFGSSQNSKESAR